MTALEIKNVKQFMNSLLLTDTFNIFLLEEAEVVTYNTFNIDGRINRNFFDSSDDAPAYEFSAWSEICPHVLNLIKGKHTPTAFRFTLLLKPEYVAGVLKDKDTTVTPEVIKALVINIRYENDRLLLVTGTSLNTFLMDKSLDPIWDQAMMKYLTKHGIEYEEA